MFNMTVTEKRDKFAGTIRVKKPIYGLGLVTDANSMKWDIHGIFGAVGVEGEQQWVWACPYNTLHPYYTDTSGDYYGFVEQTWEPYLVEVIE